MRSTLRGHGLSALRRDETPLRSAEVQMRSNEHEPDDMSDRLAQLSKLGDLKNAGIPTEAEFEQQKARIPLPLTSRTYVCFREV
jgi:hypothetical protein